MLSRRGHLGRYVFRPMKVVDICCSLCVCRRGSPVGLQALGRSDRHTVVSHSSPRGTCSVGSYQRVQSHRDQALMMMPLAAHSCGCVSVSQCSLVAVYLSVVDENEEVDMNHRATS